MPARASYPPLVLSLIQSTSYPPLPSLEELESLRTSLQTPIVPHVVPSDLEEKRLRKEKKRKDREEAEEREREKERAALEANERSGARLEALEKAKAGRIGSPAGVKVKKERQSASPVPSEGSNISRALAGPSHPVTYGSQPKKQKKKRFLGSDDETGSQLRDRSATIASPPPGLGHTTSTSGLKLKLSSSLPKGRPSVDPSPTPSASTPAALSGPGANMDFSLPAPPARPLVPPRPGVQKPPKPGPKKQSEVNEDFSNVKAPNQVNFTTFWSGIEPYLREVREDDLAMLGFKADAPESYDIPPRGRHYTEVWDEEDGNLPGTTQRFNVPNLRQNLAGNSHGALPLPHFVPANEMRDENLVDEHRGLGSFTERIVAAILGRRTIKDEAKAELGASDSEGNRGPAKVDVVDIEDRVKRELRSVMLLGEHEEFDPANRDDDEVTAALRQCQRMLHQQTAVNESRKAHLAEIAKKRIAYAEYQAALDGIEKSIEAGWAKRVKKYGMKKGQQPHAGQANGSGRPPVPDGLKRLLQVRNGWLDGVGRLMKEKPRGELVGLPTKNIFDGMGEESEEKDEKTVEDAVEVESMDVDEVDGVA
ncbi:histone acetyltransferases subunit 3-domain-containing protein [Naematelia encephala]|uniref:Histone acetyltransferases subunit 3-domain-containing protein n=1 Tax=Naematelia encephala TaxID=71784 RepID=A0A1Y2B686_9TREE|nr:histone acetyltransferases subunit 3-domain-containing protein [Naematelia encephala]